MNRKKKSTVNNYIDYIPSHSAEFEYDTDESGKVTILRNNKGIFNKIAQKLFGKPEVSYIHLDEMGSFIWVNIDGQKTIYDIAEIVKEHFGEAAEPLYNRLVQYMRTLSKCGFICVKAR